MSQFYELFSDYINNADLSKIGSAYITKFRVRKEARLLTLGLKCDELLDYKLVERVKKAICKSIELKTCNIEIKYDKSLFNLEKIETILSPIKETNSMINGFFDGADAELEENTLTVCLKKGGIALLEEKEIDNEIQTLL